jgi:hypothetical protein
LNARAVWNWIVLAAAGGKLTGYFCDPLLTFSVHQTPLREALVVVAKERGLRAFGQFGKFDRVASIAIRCA